jgi:hypothetical protein
MALANAVTVLARFLPWCCAASGAVLYLLLGLRLADRLPTWSEEVSLLPNHGYRVLPDEVPALGEAQLPAHDRPSLSPSAHGQTLPISPWCGDPSGPSTRWILSSARPVLTLCVAGRSLPVLTMPYASGVFAWPMWLALPLHHDDVFVERKIGLVRGLLALALLFVMVRRLDGRDGGMTAGLACLLAGASAPFVYPHVLLFPYETLPWTLVASAFWVWSGSRPGTAEGAARPSWRRLLGGALLAGLALLANVKAVFLLAALLLLAVRRGVSLRRTVGPMRASAFARWAALLGVAVAACSPIWLFGLLDPSEGLSHQFGWRLQTLAHKLRPDAIASELVNLCTFGSDLGFYFEQVAGRPGTHFRLGLVAVALPLAYAAVAGAAHLARRPVGSDLAAACGVVLAAYFCVSLLFYDQIPAANYSPLHCVFGATYAAFCVDAGAALARLSRRLKVTISEGRARALLVVPLLVILLGATLRRGDPVRTMTSSLNAQAERDAARYLLDHPEAHGELMTTSYNLAGVVDALGQERIHPVQAHLLLARCSGGRDIPMPSCLEDRLRWILDHESVLPLRLLVPAVVTAVDYPADVHRALPDALEAAASKAGLDVSIEARFRSGDGTEVLHLLRVE